MWFSISILQKNSFKTHSFEIKAKRTDRRTPPLLNAPTVVAGHNKPKNPNLSVELVGGFPSPDDLP